MRPENSVHILCAARLFAKQPQSETIKRNGQEANHSAGVETSYRTRRLLTRSDGTILLRACVWSDSLPHLCDPVTLRLSSNLVIYLVSTFAVVGVVTAVCAAPRRVLSSSFAGCRRSFVVARSRRSSASLHCCWSFG